MTIVTVDGIPVAGGGGIAALTEWAVTVTVEVDTAAEDCGGTGGTYTLGPVAVLLVPKAVLDGTAKTVVVMPVWFGAVLIPVGVLGVLWPKVVVWVRVV